MHIFMYLNQRADGLLNFTNFHVNYAAEIMVEIKQRQDQMHLLCNAKQTFCCYFENDGIIHEMRRNFNLKFQFLYNKKKVSFNCK